MNKRGLKNIFIIIFIVLYAFIYRAVIYNNYMKYAEIINSSVLSAGITIIPFPLEIR